MTSSPDGLERFGVAGPAAWRASVERARAALIERLGAASEREQAVRG